MPSEPISAAEPLQRRILAVCDAAGAFIEYWGFKAILGRVWTLLALRAAPMAQVDIAAALGVSRSLVSGAVAELVERGLVRRVGAHRNAPYEAVIDVWPTIADVLRSREWMLLERARMALEAALEELDMVEAAGEDAPWSRNRLRILLAMTELSQALVRMLMALRIPTAVEGVADWMRSAASLIGNLRRGP